MKFFKGFFWALLFNIILIFVSCFGVVCGVCIAKNSKFAEKLDKNFSQSITTQSLTDHSLGISSVDYNIDSDYLDNSYLEIDYVDMLLSYYLSTSEPLPTGGSYLFPVKLRFTNSSFSYTFGDYENGTFDHSGIIYYSSFGWHTAWLDPFGIGQFFRLDYFVAENFNFNQMSAVSLYRQNAWGGNQLLLYTYTLTDTNNVNCYFNFFYYAADIESDTFADFVNRRTYFVFSGSALTGNTYYQSGYDYGYQQGISNGSTEGYSEGYRNGLRVGRENGYNAGVAEANDYSFLSLIGAVVDAPLSAFTGLLNFEILGFNFLSLITGILTIGLLFVFIRFIFFRR